MRVIITLDRFDGSKNKVISTDLDGFSVQELAFLLMEADTCGVTITRELRAGELAKRTSALNAGVPCVFCGCTELDSTGGIVSCACCNAQ